MSPIRIPLSSFAALLILTAPALAQTTTEASVAAPPSVSVVLEVQRLAPQLIGLAGTDSNFQSLVNGLAQGTQVTLVTVTPEGFLQTATFTPSGRLSALDIARSLELARQNLISRGITSPTAEQIGVSLLGGALATPAGIVPVAGVLAGSSANSAAIAAVRTPEAIARTLPERSASTGSSAPTATGPTLTVTSRSLVPTTSTTVPIGAVVPPSTTSASPQLRNTSESPLPATSASPGSSTSSSPQPSSTTTPNGAPSPSVQLQNRR